MLRYSGTSITYEIFSSTTKISIKCIEQNFGDNEPRFNEILVITNMINPETETQNMSLDITNNLVITVYM